MKCFGFNKKGDEGLSVELCQEVIEYHTAREAGIPLLGNLIIKSLDDLPKYIGVWHRKDVGPFQISATREWLNSEDAHTHLFFHLEKTRKKHAGNFPVKVTLFDEENLKEPELKQEATEVVVPSLDEDGGDFEIRYPIEEKLADTPGAPPAPEFVPFKYAEIGPFMGADVYYAVRFTAHIDEPAFGKLVPENPALGVRYYQVYGVNEILRKIEWIDLPDLQRNAPGKIYEIYEEFFRERLMGAKLTPKFYSIVAIDALDSQNFALQRVHAVELQKGLRNLTSRIDSSLFEHKKFEKLRNRIFWFVTQNRSEDFMLWLEGPMAKRSRISDQESVVQSRRL